ncbi:hypothetical protein QR680_014270 [Steinernema hermaphroditum]|uniref:Uncharacterized protein n=1 Tax=Steinernema hermaphroditum TaxID=289476 RepID=A0AA39I8B3_9BILA|nr:hypothetical protein QR680_014270 [Steinernema hermaphroditum]
MSSKDKQVAQRNTQGCPAVSSSAHVAGESKSYEWKYDSEFREEERNKRGTDKDGNQWDWRQKDQRHKSEGWIRKKS